jgi:hypothetical protein
MRPNGRGPRVSEGAVALVAVVVLSLAASACSHGGDTSPTPTRTRTSPSPKPSPFPIGTANVAAWAAVWKGAFQQFANDVSDLVQAATHRDINGMRDALQRIPGDAHEAVRKIDEAGSAPPGFSDEVQRLRGLIDQASQSAGHIGADCLSNAGLACAADVATLLNVAGQLMDALKPFGVNIHFHVAI